MSKRTASHLHTNDTTNCGLGSIPQQENVRVSFLIPRTLVEDFRVAMIRRRMNASRWLREQMQAAIKAA